MVFKLNLENLENYLKQIFAELLKVPVEKIEPDLSFEEFGFDSILINKFNIKMEAVCEDLPKTLLFECQNINELAEYLTKNHTLKPLTSDWEELKPLNHKKIAKSIKKINKEPTKKIAIIGLSGTYPSSNNLDEFWSNLEKGKDLITEIPSSRWDIKDPRIYCKWGSFLEDFDKFDPLFFNISPFEAELMDPQERLFLQTSWSTIEDAGYTRLKLSQYKVGVFVGVTTNTYLLWTKDSQYPTSLPWSIANRVSYFLNFSGPSIPIDTACSSSLTAIHFACESIKKGECDMALAGGVNLYLHPVKYIQLCQTKVLSYTGRCRSFADNADGFVPGEGVGAVLLKSLDKAIADNDRIYAVISGSSINHGGKTTGYTVPNPNAQAKLISDAILFSKINPESISYVEAHGTGTILGDPVEIRGLSLAYKNYTEKKQYCAIGSLKSNIGHLESAAGIAGLTKILLQMKYKKIVPSIHCETLNPNINFDDSPFYVQKSLTEWNKTPRIAAISSFGAGGSNAHIILEEYEDTKNICHKELNTIVLSAKTEERLSAYIKELLIFIEKHNPSISDISYTLQFGRERMGYVFEIKASDINELKEKLRTAKSFHKVESQVPLQDIKLKCISLPTYPFAKERYFITKHEAKTNITYLKNSWEKSYFDKQLTISSDKSVLIFDENDNLENVNPSKAVIHTIVYVAYDINKSIYDIFNIIKAVIKGDYPDLARILFMFDSSNPFMEAVYGYGKSLSFILPKISFSAIGLSYPINRDFLIHELNIENKNLEVRYRGEDRYIRKLKKINLEENNSISLKEGGVYLITGGAGGLGLIFAKYLTEKYNANIILTGRSSKNIQKYLYLQADVTNLDEMKVVIDKVKDKYGHINGIIHAAGIGLKNSIKDKTFEEFEQTLKPKIEGTKILDELTKDLHLDLFILFSSTSSVFGDFGQCDYAVANRFLDSFAIYRESLRESGLRQGRTIAINWHLWREGGMHNKQAEELFLKTSKMKYLETEDGLYAFEMILKNNYSQVVVVTEDIVKDDQNSSLLETDIQKIAASILKLKPERLDINENLGNFGFDSISLKTLSEKLSQAYNIEITPAVFFAHSNIKSLSLYLNNNMNVDSSFSGNDVIPANQGTHSVIPAKAGIHKEDIAVIGMSGRFPGSRNLSELWNHLELEHDLITEVPIDRFNFDAFGGFIPDVDKFDPLFFKISPREAETMDPQQRLFIETVWKTVEDAGLNANDLVKKSIGVFVGVQFNDYQELMLGQTESLAQSATGTAHSMIANRVSFLMDWHGTSETIDTACSGSLIAVHRAVKSIQYGESEMAIAGGVSLILTPSSIIAAREMGVLSPDGKCKTFDKSANGYVKGEGVGAILLKPLSKAIKDNDNIYAVIKGSAVNHGGLANSLTAPNSLAQAEVLTKAYDDAKIDINDITYIEVHGTGTELGDPVEIEGLKKAFGNSQKKNFCGLSSVKTNIGHLEPAAGIAGIIKVILSMKNKKIPASLHLKNLNPYIKIEDSPFYIVKKTIDWDSAKPRRAGVSSFGFGGANCHVVLEEYENKKNEYEGNNSLFILSAKNEDRLKSYAKEIIDYLEPTISIEDLCYTFQVGRKPMEYRLAAVTDSIIDLKDKLTKFLNGESEAESKIDKFYSGNLKGDKARTEILLEGEEGKEFISSIIKRKKLEKLAKLWALGTDIEWELIYTDKKQHHKISAPTYPFLRKRYWINENLPTIFRQGTTLHPLIDSVDLSLSLDEGIVFKKLLKKNELVVSDHKVRHEPMMPGDGYVEMAFFGANFIKKNKKFSLSQMIWLKPLSVNDKKEIELVIKNQENHMYFNVQSNDALYAKGNIFEEEWSNFETVSIDEIKARSTHTIDKQTFYDRFKSMGVIYGDYFQGVQHVWGNKEEAISLIQIPKKYENELKCYTFHPTITDSALQTMSGVIAPTDLLNQPLKVHFSIGKVEVLNELKATMYSYVKNISENRFDIKILDEKGNVCLKFSDVGVAEIQDPLSDFFYNVTLSPRKIRNENFENRKILIVYSSENQSIIKTVREVYSKNDISEIKVEDISITNILGFDVIIFSGVHKNIDILDLNELDKSQDTGVLSFLRLIKFIINSKNNPQIIVITNSIESPFSGSLIGLTNSFAKEYPNMDIRNIDISNLDDIRNSVKYIQTLEPIRLPYTSESNFKKQGVYLIIGGAGGIGLAFSKYMAENYSAKLILTGRSILNEKQKKKIEEIKKSGGEVLYLQGDASNLEQMKEVIEKAKNHFGKINGVIHSAIVLEAKSLLDMDEETFRKAIYPKVWGSVILYKLLKDEPLDFMLFFSSIQSFFSNIGLSNYASACTFKDAFASYISHKSPFPVKIINWGFWGTVGIVATESHNKLMTGMGVKSIDVEEGMEAVKRILFHPFKQIAAFKTDASITAKILSYMGQIELPKNVDNYEFNKFCHNLLLNAFDKINKEKVIPAYNRLFYALNTILEEGKKIYQKYDNFEEKKEEFIKSNPEAINHIKLLCACVDNYHDILHGEIKATDVMFPDSSTELVENIYKDTYFNDLVAEVILAYIKIKREKINIIEIGAGTGGTTSFVIPKIDSYKDQIKYVYTDISNSFILHGKKEFGNYPFIDFKILNIENNVKEQGFNNFFDIVIASNVLHATKNIRNTIQNTKSLLKANGILILNEGVAKINFNTMTFGLLNGWWLFEDEEERIPQSPLLSSSMWESLLKKEGFKSAVSLSKSHGITNTLQDILIAENNFEIKKRIKKETTQIKPIENKIIEIISTSLQINRIDLDKDTPYTDFGVDSILAVEIINKINKSLDVNLRTTDLFNYSTIKKLSDHITSKFKNVTTYSYEPQENTQKTTGIAIIGISGRFPDAYNVYEFWENLSQGKNSVSEIPKERWNCDDEKYKYGAFMSDIDKFDPSFFNISQREAEIIDPQQRLFLQEAWRALEDSGYSPKSLDGKKCGVFVGYNFVDYINTMIQSNIDSEAFSFTGNAEAILPARISYYLNLKGPAISINTACSSSLVAVHLACESIYSGTSDLAIAGGVQVLTTNQFHKLSGKIGILSKDGKCKTFDESADGIAPGEGIGVLVLKPLDKAIYDKDHIYGVIKGSGINQDGKTNGITAPSAASQTELECEVYNKYNINPENITYIEAHGTGTELGDPIEVHALTDAFVKYTDKKQFCAIGSVKTNIGHTLGAAGVSSVIKVLLCLQHKELVPSLNFKKENKHIDFKNSPFFVNTERLQWKTYNGLKRMAAISSFAISGTNAHVVIEEYEEHYEIQNVSNCLIVLSAKNKDRLLEYSKLFLNFIEKNEKKLAIQDISYTLQVGRDLMKEKIAFSASDIKELKETLAQYINGKEFPFNSGNKLMVNYRRIPLPTYPFAKERCWITELKDRLVYFKPEWEKRDIENIKEYKKTILLFDTIEDRYNEIKEKIKTDIILVKDLNEFKNHINLNLETVVFLWGIENQNSMDEELSSGIYSIYYLIKMIYESNFNYLRRILFVFNKQSPFMESISGYSKSLNFIFPKLYLSTIEVLDGNISDILAKELLNCDFEPEIRYEKNYRYLKALKYIEIQKNKTLLKENGVYLITGGLGGLGLIFAKYLSQKYLAKVILTGRSDLNKKLDEEFLYIKADVTNLDDMTKVVSEIKNLYGKIDGVIHIAGISGENIIIQKQKEEFERVLAPKVHGIIALDEATKNESLDFFVAFSSTSVFLGDFGRCDYAVANCFMDSFMEKRKNVRVGKSISINWPLWRSGGMHMKKEGEDLYLKSSKIDYLESHEGIEAFEKILSDEHHQVIVMSGDKERVEKIFNRTEITVETKIESDIKKIISNILKASPDNLDINESLGNFGFDSISLKILSEKISEYYKIELTPAIFFAHNTIKLLTEFLIKTFNKEIEKKEIEKKETPHEDIAIIGMDGIFPGSKNLQEFWNNLESEKNLITEIPKDRWIWEDYHENLCRWGGFISDVDKFDPLFFKISPSEAQMMDPQHRLFTQVAWKTIEDAGYKASDLSGKQIGVFVGVQFNDYQHILMQSGDQNVHAGTGTANAMLANRISYLMNWHGPSETIDTACSSSLIAVHRGVRAIRSYECEMAICGGVSLLLSPGTIIYADKLGVISKEGKCKTFDKNADGYVKGEGVGAILLKPLSRAIADNDNIHAVIKGSAVNHGGKANSLTAPNSKAQTLLLLSAYKDANISPETISYIEVHGTGTELGDPVEIEGIKKAFEICKGKTFCGIGSVKTNIGHLEPAAGIAGIIKVILSMKNKKIPASINFSEINPYIKIKDTPFYIVEKTKNWDTKSVPRRAGISSFGFGGANAHVLLEEYEKKKNSEESKSNTIVLSAKNEERLRDYIKDFLTFLEREEDCNIDDIAYTLQIGREPMEKKFAVVVSNVFELKEKIKNYLKGESETEEIPKEFYINKKLNRISLPTYPFAKERYWVKNKKLNNETKLHPLIDKNVSTLKEQKFTTIISNNEFYSNDYIVSNQKTFPSTLYIEMARASAAIACEQEIKKIYDIALGRPLTLLNKNEELYTKLFTQNRHVEFEIRTNKKPYVQGKISYDNKLKENNKKLNIENIKKELSNVLEKKDLYSLFKTIGISYGDTFKSVQNIYYTKNEALSYIFLTNKENFIIHPSLMESIFQTTLCLTGFKSLYLPFKIGEIIIFEPLNKSCYSHIKSIDFNTFDVDIISPEGDILGIIKNFSIKNISNMLYK
ncbi:MAG: SDR family NAD(P)-dependent oxidoreductase [Desulfobacterales bacterium]|nr:SDR family NAD(P)-dependent oxidoreductase [Desulfobacterales bacterium]